MANKYRHIYTASFTSQPYFTAEDDIDLWELLAGTTPVTILSVRIGQLDYDTADNKSPVQITMGLASASGSGGAAATIRQLESRSTAALATAEYMNDVEAAILTVLVAESWGITDPYLYQPVPEERIHLASGELFVVRMTDPGYDFGTNGMCSTITFAEWK